MYSPREDVGVGLRETYVSNLNLTSYASRSAPASGTHLESLLPSLLRPDTETAELLSPVLPDCDAVLDASVSALAAPSSSQVTLIGVWFLDNFFPLYHSSKVRSAGPTVARTS